MGIKEKLENEIREIEREIDEIESEIKLLENDANLLKNLYFISDKKIENNVLLTLLERMNRILNKIKYQHLIKEIEILKNIVERYRKEIKVMKEIIKEASENDLFIKYLEKDVISIKYSMKNLKLSLKYIKEIYSIK